MSKRQLEELESKRDGLYPYLPLALALKVSDAVKELGGARSEVPKSALAKHLGDAEKGGGFSQRITSAKCFGLIAGHGSYSLTEVAKRYYFPTSESATAEALLEVFNTPPAFKSVLKSFDGDLLPSREILGNILHRQFHVPESWKDRVASFFTNSAQFVGIIDGQGYLRFSAASHRTPEETQEGHAVTKTVTVPVVHAQPTTLAQPAMRHNPNANTWTYSHKGFSVQVTTPSEIDFALWEKLSGYVQLLKPIKEEASPS